MHRGIAGVSRILRHGAAAAQPGAVVLLLAAVLAACGPQAAGKPPDRVRVQLDWTHQAQFAGLYAADRRGYFAAERLDVSLLPLPKPDSDFIGVVAGGNAEFGVGPGPTILAARAQGRAVCAIATIYRRHPLAFMTLADSGIARPQDFPSHTISALPAGGKAIVFGAMMARLGLDPGSVRQVGTGYDMTPFFSRTVDIWAGYMTNEVLAARNQGHPVKLILPDDYGVHLYGDTLFATEQLIREKPDLVLRFLRAALKGWRWAIENPDEAGRLALEYDPSLDATHQVEVMTASVPLIHTGEDEIGWMRDDIWKGMHDILLAQGILTAPMDLSQVYTMEFLRQIYGGQK
jgi:NitT/TauT family transport system substrate-binding protein